MIHNSDKSNIDHPNGSSEASFAMRVLELLDLTSLGAEDQEADIIRLCQRAAAGPGPVASVCVWPRLVGVAVKELEGTGIGVCGVANFPLGQNDPAGAVSDALSILAAGGSEVDVVIPWSALRDGEPNLTRQLVAAVRDRVGSTTITKAILETGELALPDLIRSAGIESIAGGADFLKTSTGKTPTGATLDAARVLLELIRDQGTSTGRDVGLKISGGVRTLDQAKQYLDLADEIMGSDWVGPSTFRFGASALLGEICET